MIDFLRSNTWCSREEYLWEMTVGQVRLSSFDFSHVEYGNKDKKRRRINKISSVDDLKNLNDLGMPIIIKKDNDMLDNEAGAFLNITPMY